MLSFAFVIAFIVYGNASDIAYAILSNDGAIFAPLDTCFFIQSNSEISYAKMKSEGKFCEYTQSGCDEKYLKGECESVTYIYDEPSMQYKITFYDDNKCSSSKDFGMMMTAGKSLGSNRFLNKCMVSDGLNVKITCGKGYKEKGDNECVSGGISILIGLLSIVLMMVF